MQTIPYKNLHIEIKYTVQATFNPVLTYYPRSLIYPVVIENSPLLW